MGLRVQHPIATTKIFRPRGRTGFQKAALEFRDPKVLFSGAERDFPDIPEKGFLVFHLCEGNAWKLPQDAAGEGGVLRGPVEENMVYGRSFLGDHALMVTAPFELEKRKKLKKAGKSRCMMKSLGACHAENREKRFYPR